MGANFQAIVWAYSSVLLLRAGRREGPGALGRGAPAVTGAPGHRPLAVLVRVAPARQLNSCC